MDRFHAMTVFARVADAGSFTKAAESLGVSRASVSSTIQQLEAHLGARLIQRTTRRVSLTPEGRAFEERCRRILADLDDSEQLFQRSTSRAGRLTLDVPTRIARRVLIPALPEYLAKNPGLEVRLGASDRTIDLVEKGVDAVVRVGPLRTRATWRPLGGAPQVNCASPSYLARHPPPKRLEDLARHVLVHYSPKLGGAAEWDYVAGGVLRSRRVDSAVTVDNAETYVACALAGLGIIRCRPTTCATTSSPARSSRSSRISRRPRSPSPFSTRASATSRAASARSPTGPRRSSRATE